MTRFRLTRAQWSKLAGGECVGIGGKGDAPVKKGEVIAVTPRISIQVLRVDRFGESWRLHYVLTDRRDPVRMLRRTPPVVVPEADDAPTAEAIKRGSRESNYTGSAKGAITDAGEAVDEQTQARFTREAREGFKVQLERERREREARSLDTRLRLVQELAAERGIDLTRKLASIEQRIASAEREVGRDDV